MRIRRAKRRSLGRQRYDDSALTQEDRLVRARGHCTVGCAACSLTSTKQSVKTGKPPSGSISTADLLSAPVPAICSHKAGRLANGKESGIPAIHGFAQLAWLHESEAQKAALTAFGDLSGDGKPYAATVLT